MPRTRMVPTRTSSADRITPDSSLMKFFMVVIFFCVCLSVREKRELSYFRFTLSRVSLFGAETRIAPFRRGEFGPDQRGGGSD